MLDFEPLEALPDQCPPDGADRLSGLFVRLVESGEFDDDFCASFAAKGRKKKKVDPCIWAGCSLVIYDEDWVDGPIARVREFAAGTGILPYKPFGAIMRITPRDGLGRRGDPDSPHVSFWMAKTFVPRVAVTDVVSLL